MGWLRNKNTLKVFSFLYGPIRREARGGEPMSAKEWRAARTMMAFCALALGSACASMAGQWLGIIAAR